MLPTINMDIIINQYILTIIQCTHANTFSAEI